MKMAPLWDSSLWSCKIEGYTALQLQHLLSRLPINMSCLVSPFLSALPLPRHILFEYDEDGDAIMTDAATGLPIRYDGGSQDTESLEEGERRNSTDTLIMTPVAAVSPPVAALCPPAPARPPRFSLNPEDDDDEDTVMRDLTQQMAEMVLDGEPRDDPLAAAGIPPVGGEPSPAEDWCVSVTVSDLALRLDMRHPRVLLNLLRFVSTYNEMAPPDERIYLPPIPQERVEHILSHESVVNPVPEFADQVAELRYLVDWYTEKNDDESDGYSSDSSYSYYRYGRD